MTVRTRESSRMTVHAGPAVELAAVALEYADGKRASSDGTKPHHFYEAAARLLTGHLAESAGRVEFWPDREDGTPFQGARDYRPDPDPVWLAEQASKAGPVPASTGQSGTQGRLS